MNKLDSENDVFGWREHLEYPEVIDISRFLSAYC